MGKSIRLILLVSAVLFLPHFVGIPGSVERGIFVGAVVAAESPAPTLGRRTARGLKKAVKKMNAGDYAGAHKVLDKLAARHLNSYERAVVLNNKGRVFFLEDDFTAALRSYDELLALPDLPKGYEDSIRRAREQTALIAEFGAETLAEQASSSDYLPIVRVIPVYPRKAARKRIEGYAVLEFTVTEEGKVINPVVLAADPPGYFEKAALRTVKMFKYKPKVVEGEAVAVDGVRAKITFNIAD